MSMISFKPLLSFLVIVFGYGFLINIMFYGLLNFRFDIFSLSGFGLLYYFLTEEILVWFRPKKIQPGGSAEVSRGEKLAEEAARKKEAERKKAGAMLEKKTKILQNLRK